MAINNVIMPEVKERDIGIYVSRALIFSGR